MTCDNTHSNLIAATVFTKAILSTRPKCILLYGYIYQIPNTPTIDEYGITVAVDCGIRKDQILNLEEKEK
jgi:hypothetical protein